MLHVHHFFVPSYIHVIHLFYIRLYCHLRPFDLRFGGNGGQTNQVRVYTNQAPLLKSALIPIYYGSDVTTTLHACSLWVLFLGIFLFFGGKTDTLTF
ncbi:hypothetical protein Naga_100461g2 [Nannochloropsis gaditana]|uniref:Uncharacterized protein n=1 Tax=Nannochloropsis gaditana TaxID=72520 RepID=W7TR46_9STRA|nr:hypothetical protein Naga_100461g2 [Nannochloropsis gaditana]